MKSKIVRKYTRELTKKIKKMNYLKEKNIFAKLENKSLKQNSIDYVLT